MKYYVLSSLKHNGEHYLRGSGIELPENSKDAKSLLDAGVISETTPEDAEFAPPSSSAETDRQPAVGGQAIHSGEPSLDDAQDTTAHDDAEDVTPEVSEKMTREELEEAARAKGISDEDIAAAPNKAALVDLIAPQEAATEEHDPSANL